MRGSRSIVGIALPLVLLGTFSLRAGAADAPPDLSLQLDSLFREVPYATFEWGAKKGVSERAAMHVPVTLDGEEGWFQVDTGLDVTLLYGDVAKRRGWDTAEGMYRVPDMRIGGMDLGPVWLRAREDRKPKGKSDGSIGLDLLFGRLVIIDYPRRRIAWMDRGRAPAWLWQRASWTPGEIRDHKFFVNVSLGRESLEGIFFDTGTSAFPLTVDLDRWRELTGREGPDETTTEWKVSSWGNDVTVVGAPAIGDLVIGSVRVEHPPVFYIAEQPKLFQSWPFPAGGLVGNAPFWDDVIVLDLTMWPRLGVVR